MTAADIDGDGRDELVIGSAALDDNGKPIWNTGLGHNDVGYVADIDPSNPGLEVFYGIEPARSSGGMGGAAGAIRPAWAANRAGTGVVGQA